jgi:hypothetical protein
MAWNKLNTSNTTATDETNYYKLRTQQNNSGKIRVCSYNSESFIEGVTTVQNWMASKGFHYVGIQETLLMPAGQNFNNLAPFYDYKMDRMDFGIGTVQVFVFDSLTSTETQIQTAGFSGGTRGLAKIETYIRGKKVSLYNTHIAADSTGVEVQAEIANVISVLDADPNPYKILTGDFNVKDTNYFDGFLTNYKLCNGKGGVWLDSFKNTPYGTTKAIDNIIVTKNIDILSVQLDSTLTLSDHNAIYADLMLT